jgi:hypothetical protein
MENEMNQTRMTDWEIKRLVTDDVAVYLADLIIEHERLVPLLGIPGIEQRDLAILWEIGDLLNALEDMNGDPMTMLRGEVSERLSLSVLSALGNLITRMEEEVQ